MLVSGDDSSVGVDCVDCDYEAMVCLIYPWLTSRACSLIYLRHRVVAELSGPLSVSALQVDALQDPTVTVAQAASKEYTDYMLTQSALPVAAVGSNGSGGSGSCAAPN